jgi:hypothetical protein
MQYILGFVQELLLFLVRGLWREDYEKVERWVVVYRLLAEKVSNLE